MDLLKWQRQCCRGGTRGTVEFWQCRKRCWTGTLGVRAGRIDQGVLVMAQGMVATTVRMPGSHGIRVAQYHR